jgi:hypothetical protein
MFQFILFPGLGGNIFQETDITEIELFVPPEIKQVDDDWYENRQQTI